MEIERGDEGFADCGLRPKRFEIGVCTAKQELTRVKLDKCPR
jgi:hypothetical protein